MFAELSPETQAFLATCFTWGVTALGASLVFFINAMRSRVLDAMLGFAAGVMIAASFWSLLAPSIEMAESSGMPAWLPALVGFLSGGAFLRLIDWLLPHLHPGNRVSEAEGLPTHWRRSWLMVLAITLHNIPEGLAVGVIFGAAAHGDAPLVAAISLAIGIGLQNFPEGAAVSMPLRQAGMSARRSFWYGQLSGMVEPVAGVVGALAVTAARPLLPYALSFAAGAMIYVVVEEVIPEAQRHQHADLATIGTMVGFAVMMFLDVALG